MTKISELPDGIQAVPGDLFAAVRGGVTHQIPFPDAVGDIGILTEAPDALTLDAKAVLVNYGSKIEEGLFSSNVDQVTGEMTVPTEGLYTIHALAIGTMAAPGINEVTSMYLRISNAGAQDGDHLIGITSVASNMVDKISWAATFTRTYPIGAVLSIVLEASANLGLLTFDDSTFEVHLA